MDTSILISITGRFFQSVGEIVAELKRQELAKLDADLLTLKRQLLAEKHEEFESDLEDAVRIEKARTEQDLISRGLGNTTIRQSSLRAIENDAARELNQALREYNRALEEIALMERNMREQAESGWKKLLRRVGLYRRG